MVTFGVQQLEDTFQEQGAIVRIDDLNDVTIQNEGNPIAVGRSQSHFPVTLRQRNRSDNLAVDAHLHVIRGEDMPDVYQQAAGEGVRVSLVG
jgi:hypothetical protein